MSDYNKPIKEDLYEGILTTIRALFTATVRLLDSRDTDPANKPDRAKRWNATNSRFESWEGGAWSTIILGVEGGGTGAESAVLARGKLSVPSITDLTDHTSATAAHSATSAATASRIIIRDAAGRAKVAAPSAADDIARLDTVTNTSTSFLPAGDFTSGTIWASLTGNIVGLRWSDSGHASLAAATTSAGVVPASYRPAATVEAVYSISATRIALVSVTAAGTVTMSYRNWTGATVVQTASDVGCISYPTN